MKIDCQWIAHRGYPSRYPENTLLGFEQAIAAGARYIETDIQLTADAVPIAFHDARLDKLCGVNDGVSVHDCSWQTLSAYSPYAPERCGAEFKGVPLLSLDDLLALLVKHPQVTCLVEIKALAITAHGEAGVLDAVLPRLAALAEQIILISYHIPFLHAAKQRGWARIGPVLASAEQLCALEIEALEPDLLLIGVDDLPAQKPPVVAPIACFECSDIEVARRLVSWGVSYIETDAIAEMLSQAS